MSNLLGLPSAAVRTNQFPTLQLCTTLDTILDLRNTRSWLGDRLRHNSLSTTMTNGTSYGSTEGTSNRIRQQYENDCFLQLG